MKKQQSKKVDENLEKSREIQVLMCRAIQNNIDSLVKQGVPEIMATGIIFNLTIMILCKKCVLC